MGAAGGKPQGWRFTTIHEMPLGCCNRIGHGPLAAVASDGSGRWDACTAGLAPAILVG
jgi:hypothetical protein